MPKKIFSVVQGIILHNAHKAELVQVAADS